LPASFFTSGAVGFADSRRRRRRGVGRWHTFAFLLRHRRWARLPTVFVGTKGLADAQIGGLDLSDPDTCFNLQLATRAWSTLCVLRSR
jgi:hypothetical protein